MATIDIGSGATNRDGSQNATYTTLCDGNYANATGILDSFEIWFVTDATGLKMGTFSGSGTTYDDRDYESIGNVTSGSKQTFTGKNCSVSQNDLLGAYWATGQIERNATDGGNGNYWVSGDKFGSGSTSYSDGDKTVSMYATGYTPPSAPTNVAATENDSAKVTITWTKSSGATNYAVYADGDNLSGTIEDVATYDDTSAAAPVITAGSSVASDGTYGGKVALSLSGESIADGTSYSYTVKAYNAAGWSGQSSANSGYRKAASLSYQWQVSAGDSDASYSDITGATSSTHTFYDAPAGVGRYYRCKITATGSTTQYSTAERGFRAFISPIVII